MTVSVKSVKELREKTGAGFADCKKALSSCNSDMEKAVEWLKKQGIAQMAERASQEASEGSIGSYVHGGRIGVLVEVNTETDFSARSEAFKKFVKDLTLHITSMNPLYISEEDIDENVIQKQAQIFKDQLKDQKKSEAVINQIVDGQMNKWKKEICLLNQSFARPGSYDEKEISVQEALAELTNQIREKVVIRRFIRYELGA